MRHCKLMSVGVVTLALLVSPAAAQVVVLEEQAKEQVPAPAPPAVQPPTVRPPAPPAVRPPAPPADSRPQPAAAQPMDWSNQPAALTRAAPRMIGDFPGYFGSGFVTSRSLLSAGPFPGGITIGGPTAPGTIVVVPPGGSIRDYAEIIETYQYSSLALSRGPFKIAENEAVQPQDRIYVTYNYYHQVPNQLLAAGGLLNVLPNPLVQGQRGPYVLRSTLDQTLGGGNTPGQPSTLTTPAVSATNLSRETFGFEKTFLGGNASVGMRVPLFQTDVSASTPFDPNRLQSFSTFPTTGDTVATNSTLGPSRFGDLTMIFKYAFINDPNGDLTASGGMVVTAPTGGGIVLADGSRLYSTMLQPWVGAYRAWDRFFVHGFTSLAFPTDDRDLTLSFTDFGAGYFAYQNPDGWLSSVTPTIECHVNVPFQNNRGSGISSPDVVALTGGLILGLGRSTSLTIAAATPVTGPRPNQLEAAIQLNWGF